MPTIVLAEHSEGDYRNKSVRAVKIIIQFFQIIIELLPISLAIYATCPGQLTVFINTLLQFSQHIL